jgi:hypothetical protein
MFRATAGCVIKMRVILKIALWVAILVSVISALLFTVINAVPPLPRTLLPTVWDLVKTTVLLLPITAVSCGSFGALAGIVGGTFLVLRRRRIHSTRRLMIESGIAGFILGLGYPFFDRLLNHYAQGWAILSAPVGLICAMICAASFRNQLITEQFTGD